MSTSAFYIFKNKNLPSWYTWSVSKTNNCRMNMSMFFKKETFFVLIFLLVPTVQTGLFEERKKCSIIIYIVQEWLKTTIKQFNKRHLINSILRRLFYGTHSPNSVLRLFMSICLLKSILSICSKFSSNAVLFFKYSMKNPSNT